MLSKWKCYGLGGNVGDWICHFLPTEGRKSRFKDLDKYSESYSFNLFFHALPVAVSSTLSVFANDTKLYRNFASLMTI